MMKGEGRERKMEVRSVGPSSKVDIAAVAMEVDQEPIGPEPGAEQRVTTLDSDDETLRFDKDDDLYDSGLDEDDARWVRRQVNHIICVHRRMTFKLDHVAHVALVDEPDYCTIHTWFNDLMEASSLLLEIST